MADEKTYVTKLTEDELRAVISYHLQRSASDIAHDHADVLNGLPASALSLSRTKRIHDLTRRLLSDKSDSDKSDGDNNKADGPDMKSIFEHQAPPPQDAPVTGSDW